MHGASDATLYWPTNVTTSTWACGSRSLCRGFPSRGRSSCAWPGTPRRGRYGLLYALHSLGKSEAENYHTVHATYRDCPETVDPETVTDAKANTPPEIFRREWECDFDSAEGLVYGLFDEAFHVRKPRPDAHYNDGACQ